MYKITSIYMD